MKLRHTLALGPLFALTVLACGRETTAPRRHTVSGPVKLTGYLVEVGGHFAGTKVVGDADGITVELYYGPTFVARTQTVDGVYTFTDIGPGAYTARTQIVGGVGDTTEPLTVATLDVGARDTLRLTSLGDLVPEPNPLDSVVYVYYELDVTKLVEISVYDLGGRLVRALRSGTVDAGLRSVTWDGRNSAGVPAPAGIYWVTLTSGADVRAHLLFKESGLASRVPIDPEEVAPALRSPRPTARR
jgi:hypothetical protein